MLAAQRGNTSLVTFLLNHGADPSHIDHQGYTAFTKAQHFGHTDIVRLLQTDNTITTTTSALMP